LTDPGRPHTNSVVARFEGGWRCRVEAGGFDLVVDEPPGSGGTGTGPMPTEYLLTAMASCYALALNWAAGKRGTSLPGLVVTATGTYDGPRFSRLQLTVTCDAPAEQVEGLLEPALRGVLCVQHDRALPADRGRPGLGAWLCSVTHAQASPSRGSGSRLTARRDPRRCHIVVALTTAMSHRRGSAARAAGAAVKGGACGFRWASG